MAMIYIWSLMIELLEPYENRLAPCAYAVRRKSWLTTLEVIFNNLSLLLLFGFKDLYQVKETFKKLSEFSTAWEDRAVFGSPKKNFTFAKVPYFGGCFFMI